MKSLQPWRTFFALPVEQKRLALGAFVCVAGASFALRLLPMRWVLEGLGVARDLGFAAPPHDQIAQARQVARMVETVASRLPGHPACLPQAVALKWMLNRRCLGSAIVLGARSGRRDDGSLDAHAWVQIGNQIIIGGARSKEYQILGVFC